MGQDRQQTGQQASGRLHLAQNRRGPRFVRAVLDLPTQDGDGAPTVIAERAISETGRSKQGPAEESEQPCELPRTAQGESQCSNGGVKPIMEDGG